jgi:hypothetical protein
LNEKGCRKNGMKKTMHPIYICFLSLLFTFSIWNPAVQAETRRSNADEEYRGMHRETDMTKILSVLGKKVDDQKMLERTREKLFTLQEPQFSLIASLSEQIIKEGNQPGVDIAFLLITILIVLS